MLMMSQVREVRQLDTDWKFFKGENKDAFQESFNDA